VASFPAIFDKTTGDQGADHGIECRARAADLAFRIRRQLAPTADRFE
jgi:hypothetical protein